MKTLISRRPAARAALILALLGLVAIAIGNPSRSKAESLQPMVVAAPDHFFHGKADDQAYKNTYTGDPSADGHLTFDTTAPAGTAPIVQTTTAVANADYVGNPLGAFWAGHLANGSYNKDMDLSWYWATANGLATVSGADVEVSVFADPNWSNNSGTLIGRTTVSLGQVGPTPTLETSVVPINGSVSSGEIVVQVTAVFIDTGEDLRVFYDSTSTPSGFALTAPSGTTNPPPTVDFSTGLKFSPATTVSAHFMGAEPQLTIERRPPNSKTTALNPSRNFIDWPLSSRTNIGQLSRSTDGGGSYRLLFDPTCAPRSRPTCTTGGGGDTENTVNLFNGHVFFADQEVLANEALGSSVDHGDTFPTGRQFALTNVITGVDRQWLSAAGGKPVTTSTGQTVDAFLSYHIPAAGEYIQGIDKATGAPIPQPAPQLTSVSQSGQSAYDTSNGPGSGWIYQPYRDGAGYEVGTAPANNFQDPTAWQVNHVSDDVPNIFPWLQLDDGGNAYAVWVTNGVVYYSFSPINDPRNDPSAGGRPGTYWSPQVRVTPSNVLSSVFPEVTGGSQGRVAITFDGTTDPKPCAAGETTGCGPGATYLSDDAPVSAKWSTYAVVLRNALAAGGDPIHATTGVVSHRTIHQGSICTSGTTCTGDRSLLDMIDIKSDQLGRTGVVFTNNFSDYQNHGNADDGPFVTYAEQTVGPSLQAHSPLVDTMPFSPEAAGDATWPNKAGAPNLASLDIHSGASLSLSNGKLVAKIPLGATSKSRMASDLDAYNATGSNIPPADRLQYLFRFETENKIFHIDYEYNADGTTDAFGGKLDDNDRITNGTTTIASGYHHDAGFDVTASIDQTHHVLTLRAPASEYGLSSGERIFSATAFTFAGPSDANETLITDVSRTVDATPPVDKKL